jgi:hypothetical protein
MYDNVKDSHFQIFICVHYFDTSINCCIGFTVIQVHEAGAYNNLIVKYNNANNDDDGQIP